MGNGKIAAVVVTYNRLPLLQECVKKLEAQTAPCDILIVNNASTDGTTEWLGEQRRVLRSVKYLPKERSSYLFIWVSVWKDGSVCTMNLQRETLTKNLKGFERKLQPVTMASFVSLFLPAGIVREMGLPIKDFFIWTDDWEFTRRISRKYLCYAVADSVVVHKSKSNMGANIGTESEDRLDRFDYLYRNDVYLYRREGLKGFCYEAVRLSGHIVRVLLKSRDNKAKRIGKIIGGTKTGLRFHPEIEFVE